MKKLRYSSIHFYSWLSTLCSRSARHLSAIVSEQNSRFQTYRKLGETLCSCESFWEKKYLTSAGNRTATQQIKITERTDWEPTIIFTENGYFVRGLFLYSPYNSFFFCLTWQQFQTAWQLDIIADPLTIVIA